MTLAAPRVAEASIYEIHPVPTTVRLIRDVTPSGNIRVLMTNLLDARRYPAEQFGRSTTAAGEWRRPSSGSSIACAWRRPAGSPISPFSRTSPPRWPTTSASCSAPRRSRPTPPSRPNRTYAQGALKPILAGCLLALEHARNQLQTVLDTIACNHCRVQPERSYPRPSRVKPHQHLAYKGA